MSELFKVKRLEIMRIQSFFSPPLERSYINSLLALVFISLTCNFVFSQVTNYPYSESFESGFGDWSNANFNDYDWQQDSNGTPSGSTGPSNASDGTFYLYAEATGEDDYDVAYVYAEFDLTGNYSSASFSFDYHMYGSDMGYFNVYVYDGGWIDEFQVSGNQGNQWLSQSIDLSSYIGSTIQIYFRCIRGDGYRSDIAIDNINLDVVDNTDTDGDGIVDSDDLDDDNDGILDSDECGYDSYSFSWGNGGSVHSFSQYDVTAFYVDFDYIDNSTSITINGNDLHPNNILQMENVAAAFGEVKIVCDSDGALLTSPWLPNNNGLPRLRVDVNESGVVTLYGSRAVNSTSLELMTTQTGAPFNTISYISGLSDFEVVNPDDIGEDGISGTAYFKTDCDTDLDGIPNRLDLDSDGDGCSDAFEGGATSDETADFQFSDVVGDANGLSPTVDPLDDGVINYTLSSDFTDAGTVSCSCPFTNGADNDGDGYDDLCDQDDDNDGILDLSEYGSCGDGQSLDWNAHYASGSSYTEGDRPSVDSPSSPLTFDGTTSITYSQTENITAQGETVEFRINDQYEDGSFTLYQEALIDARSTHTFEFSEPVYNISFTLFDIDAVDGTGHFQDYIQINMINSEGVVYALSSSDYTTESSNEFLSQNTFRGVNAANGNVTIANIPDWIVSLNIIYYNGILAEDYNFSDGSFQGMAIGDIAFCTAADSDNDGIIDARELDSDADGCPDAIEVGYTYEDIYLTGANEWEMDTIIDSNGIPLGAGVASNSDVVTTSSQGPNCESFFVLAVELSEFTAVRNGNVSLLEWTTLTERKNDYFEVYWKTDTEDWIKIGEVKGAGYSDSELNYSYIHPQPKIGNNYYKISAVDFNGVGEESEIKTVVFAKDLNGVILYPNPNKDHFVIANLDVKSLRTIEIYTINGQKVQVNYELLQTELFFKHDLSKGVYFIHLEMNDGTLEQLKFIVK